MVEGTHPVRTKVRPPTVRSLHQQGTEVSPTATRIEGEYHQYGPGVMKYFSHGMTGDVENARKSTEPHGLCVTQEDVMAEPPTGNLQEIAGNVCPNVDRQIGKGTTTAMPASDQILISAEICSESSQHTGIQNPETHRDGLADPLLLNHRSLLRGSLDNEDVTTNDHRLGYDGLWNPVFRINVQDYMAEFNCCM